MEFDISKYHLLSTALFESLSIESLARVKSKLVRKEYEAGEYLFREKSYPKGIYLVRKGKIKIFQTNAEGKQNIVTIYKKGDYFGHRPLLAEEKHPVSAVAMSGSVVSFLGRDEFFYQLDRSPEFSKSLLENLSKEFSVWVNKTTVFAQYGVKARTALSLLILNEIFQRDENSRNVIITINRDDFAAFVGTAKETLVRMLRQFKDDGIIKTSGSKIMILRPRALFAILNAL